MCSIHRCHTRRKKHSMGLRVATNQNKKRILSLYLLRVLGRLSLYSLPLSLKTVVNYKSNFSKDSDRSGNQT